jgi:hypothetical protein
MGKVRGALLSIAGGSGDAHCAMTTPRVRRLAPSELKALDLTLSDPRIHWAKRARSSSSWSESYAPSTACGPPSVFPEHGDRSGTWLAASGDARPWIELEMPTLDRAHALLICETCAPGGITSVRDQDGAIDLFVAEERAIRPLDGARLLVVPLDPALPAPARIRIGLKRSNEYQEIDAVALVTVPFEELMAAPVTLGELRHRRFAPEQVRIHDLHGDRRIVWAMSAKASSEWSSSYAAKAATGRPNVFPKGGDHSGTWLSDTSDRNAWIELSFGKASQRSGDCYGFIVLETCGAGAVVRATNEHEQVLWQAGVGEVPHRQARLLYVPLEPARPPNKLRLHLSGAIEDYREIDAVALLYAPLEDLETEAPPPPPPPIPGAPREGFTFMEGTLLGVSAERPLVHAVLRTSNGAHALMWGPALRLRLESGAEVELELQDTTVFGDPLRRRRGRFADLSAELPALGTALGTSRAPADDDEVVVQGQQIASSLRVHVAGVPYAVSDGGFRERANVPEKIRVAVISREPLSATPFMRDGTDTFRAGASKLGAHDFVPHPLSHWVRNAVGVAGVGLAAVLAMLLLTQDGAVGWGAGLLAFALCFAACACIFAIELIGRANTVFVVGRKGSGKRNGRAGFSDPKWTLVWLVTFVGITAFILSGALSSFDVDARLPAFVLASVLGGAYALVRSLMWQWSAGWVLWTALRALMRKATTGVLTSAHRSTEVLEAHIEHLGTEQYADADGRIQTRERYKEWTTRSARADHQVTLALPDARRASPVAPRVVIDVAMTPVKIGAGPKHGPAPTAYASFASEHEVGDVASLIGQVVEDGGELKVNDAIVLLGPRSVLVRRTLIMAACMLALWGFALTAVAVVVDGVLPYL